VASTLVCCLVRFVIFASPSEDVHASYDWVDLFLRRETV
jgi:hypothetical protein